MQSISLKVRWLERHISGPRGTAVKCNSVELHTLNTDEVVVSHALISVGVPQDGVLVSSGIEDRKNLTSSRILESRIVHTHVNAIVLLTDGDSGPIFSLHGSSIDHLVQELLTLEGSSDLEVLERGDGEVGVKGGLEVEGLLTLVLNEHLGGKLIGLKLDGKCAQELLVPHLLGVIRGGHLEHDTGVAHGLDLPVDVTGETVLLDLTGTELGPAVAETSTDGLASIDLGIGSDGNVLNAINNVRGDHTSKQIHITGSTSLGVDELDIFQTLIIGHEASGSYLSDGRVAGGSTSFAPRSAGGSLLCSTAGVQSGGRTRYANILAGHEGEGRSRSEEDGGKGELHDCTC
mmetsp:Transcript_27926/g.43368  ORF Transcript_27926/g.43368 Transcript_27926/m.43368 type:complete len:347 (+) Transcript_27926:122-1162(+)